MGLPARVASQQSSHEGERSNPLDASINSNIKKPGTLSKNLTQCLRDCGVVPKKKPGNGKRDWRKPVDGL
eukprot:1740159-Rhodomonas_salina.2